MKKIIKKFGDSYILRISPDEMKIFNLKEGSIVNVEIKPDETRRVLTSK